MSSVSSSPPTTPVIVVLDNGSGLVKAGLAGEGKPRLVVPNCAGSLIGVEKQKQKQHYADSLYGCSQFYFHRPFRQGLLVDTDLQCEIWKAAVFSNHRTVDSGAVWSSQGIHPPETGLLVTEPFNAPQATRQGLVEVLFEDMQFHHVVVCPSQQLIPFSYSISSEGSAMKFLPFVAQRTPTGGVRTGRRGRPPKRPPQPCGFDSLPAFGQVTTEGDIMCDFSEAIDASHGPAETISGLPAMDPFANAGWENPCRLVVDIGHQATWAMPFKGHVPLDWATKRLDLAGQHLTAFLSRILSIRHLNMETNPLLVQHIKEDLCYLSLDFLKELRQIQSEMDGWRGRHRPHASSAYACYEIPDFSNPVMAMSKVLSGYRRIAHFPHALMKNDTAKTAGVLSNGDTDMQHTKTFDSARGQSEHSKTDVPIWNSDKQILHLNHELICVPELLFYPSDAPADLWTPKESPSSVASSEAFREHGPAGLADLVVSAIRACPPDLQAAMAANIYLAGGTARLVNLTSRLYNELRQRLPEHWPVRLHRHTDDTTWAAWRGGSAWVASDPLNFHTYATTREEYEEQGAARVVMKI